jgi:hypothetical protein
MCRRRGLAISAQVRVRLVVTWNGPLSKRLILDAKLQIVIEARFRLSEMNSVTHSGLPA